MKEPSEDTVVTAPCKILSFSFFFFSHSDKAHVWFSHSCPRHILRRAQEEDRLMYFHSVVTADRLSPHCNNTFCSFRFTRHADSFLGGKKEKKEESCFDEMKDPFFIFYAQVNGCTVLDISRHHYKDHLPKRPVI